MTIETGRSRDAPVVASAHVGPAGNWKSAVQEARASTRKSVNRRSQRLAGDDQADKENVCPPEVSLATKEEGVRRKSKQRHSDDISSSDPQWEDRLADLEARLADQEARLVERDFALTTREQQVDDQNRSNEEKVMDLEVVEMRLAARAKQLADAEAACSAHEMALAKREEALKHAERQMRAEAEARNSARETDLAKREEALKHAEQQFSDAAFIAREQRLKAREEQLKESEVNAKQVEMRAKKLAEQEFVCHAREEALRRREDMQKLAEGQIHKRREQAAVMFARQRPLAADTSVGLRAGAVPVDTVIEQCEPTWWSVVDEAGQGIRSAGESDMELSDDDKSQARLSRAPSRGCLDDFLRLAELSPKGKRHPAKSSRSPIENQPKIVRFGQDVGRETSLQHLGDRATNFPVPSSLGISKVRESTSSHLAQDLEARNPAVCSKVGDRSSTSTHLQVSGSCGSGNSKLAPRSLLTTFDGHACVSHNKQIDWCRSMSGEGSIVGAPRAACKDNRDADCMSVASSVADSRNNRRLTARKTIASRQSSRQTSCCPSPDCSKNDTAGSAFGQITKPTNPDTSIHLASAPIPAQDEKLAAPGLGARLSMLASRIRISMGGAAPSAQL